MNEIDHTAELEAQLARQSAEVKRLGTKRASLVKQRITLDAKIGAQFPDADDPWEALDDHIRGLWLAEKTQGCFNCSKSFKPPTKWWRPWRWDLLEACPDCGGELYPAARTK